MNLARLSHRQTPYCNKHLAQKREQAVDAALRKHRNFCALPNEQSSYLCTGTPIPGKVGIMPASSYDDSVPLKTNLPMNITLSPIGTIHSPFKEKFGVPRQPGIASAARATLELLPPYDREEALEGLAGFSHIWVLFVFHATAAQGWNPTVRPPRLGGNARVGVFASRSTFRPNPIGMSVVELDGITREDGKLVLHIKGADILDGTPVLDIKPYVPYADSLPDARGGFADSAPGNRLSVQFTAAAEAQLAVRELEHPQLRELITQVLSADPRPAYRDDEAAERIYGMRLFDFDLRWRVEGNSAVVVELRESM